MTDNNVQQDKGLGQEDQQQNQNDNADYKSLYESEVSNAKKLRKRAQEAETGLKTLSKEQEAKKLEQMKEQENFQQLSETLQGKLDEVTPYKERWETFEAQKREELLSKLSEEDREALKGEKIQTLELFVKKSIKSNNDSIKHIPGQGRKLKDVPDNPFALPPEERKKVWNDVLDRHRNKV